MITKLKILIIKFLKKSYFSYYFSFPKKSESKRTKMIDVFSYIKERNIAATPFVNWCEMSTRHIGPAV